jgi:copper(I)-binding protein
MGQAMKLKIFVAVCSLFAATAFAADVEVKSAWARGTVPAQQVSGAFMALSSKGGAALVGVTSPAADAAEIHEMRLEGGVMKMRAVPRIDLSAGKTVTLKPGGYHIMLMGLKQQLKAGDRVPLTLQIEGRDGKVENVEVRAEVRELNAAEGTGHHHHH